MTERATRATQASILTVHGWYDVPVCEGDDAEKVGRAVLAGLEAGDVARGKFESSASWGRPLSTPLPRFSKMTESDERDLSAAMNAFARRNRELHDNLTRVQERCDELLAEARVFREVAEKLVEEGIVRKAILDRLVAEVRERWGIR